MLKQFRVKEVYKVTRWTYIKARNESDAMDCLDHGEGESGDDIDEEYVSTDWGSLEEIGRD